MEAKRVIIFRRVKFQPHIELSENSLFVPRKVSKW